MLAKGWVVLRPDSGHVISASRFRGFLTSLAWSGLQVLQANLELPRCVLGDVLDYQMAAALLQRFTSKEELRWEQLD